MVAAASAAALEAAEVAVADTLSRAWQGADDSRSGGSSWNWRDSGSGSWGNDNRNSRWAEDRSAQLGHSWGGAAGASSSWGSDKRNSRWAEDRSGGWWVNDAAVAVWRSL